MTVRVLCEVCNSGNPELALNDTSLKKYQLTKKDNILKFTDCRVYRNVICFGALRSARDFMDAVSNED